ncbi:MAG TPA: histidine kinase [Thermomicrobiales bacterium]|nr:histidine kinase [Thermomicrobiales bacterium]
MTDDDNQREIRALRPEELGLGILGSILDVALDGILVATDQRTIIYVNSAMVPITGRPHAELIGLDYLELITPRSRNTILDYTESSLAGKTGRRRVTILRPDGEEREIEYSNMLLSAPDGPLICSIIRDVTDVRRREREASSLAQIAASLTLDQPMERTLDSLAAHVVDATRAIATAVLLMDESGQYLRTVGTHGLPEGAGAALEAAWPAAINRSPVARAFQTQRVFIMRDARARNLPAPADDDNEIQDMIQDVAWDTIVAVPLVYHGRGLGVLNAYFLPDAHPDGPEIEFLKAIADQAAVAVENARLYHAAQQKAALEERQRLARELHDSVSQALYGIGLGARTARTLLDIEPERAGEPLDYVLQLAEAGLTEMRSLIFELRPESLEREGIVTALNRQARALRARHSIQVDVTTCAEPEAPLDTKEAIYRIAQEALHNVVKHARATSVSMQLAASDQALILTIHDNGIGFDPTGSFPGHLGLSSMRERTTRLGGTFDIQSAPTRGTTLTATVPLSCDA